MISAKINYNTSSPLTETNDVPIALKGSSFLSHFHHLPQGSGNLKDSSLLLRPEETKAAQGGKGCTWYRGPVSTCVLTTSSYPGSRTYSKDGSSSTPWTGPPNGTQNLGSSTSWHWSTSTMCSSFITNVQHRSLPTLAPEPPSRASLPYTQFRIVSPIPTHTETSVRPLPPSHVNLSYRVRTLPSPFSERRILLRRVGSLP